MTNMIGAHTHIHMSARTYTHTYTHLFFKFSVNSPQSFNFNILSMFNVFDVYLFFIGEAETSAKNFILLTNCVKVVV